MTCPQCRATVPDRSVFCLACGTRLAPAAATPPGNGTGAPAPAPAGATAAAAGSAPAAVPAAPAAPVAADPTARQAYALSFRAIVDERLRYRLARWVVERAPAHAIGEVQEDLQRGTFLTFLALTAEEAATARRGIEGLGVAPALVHLAPATAAELLLPTTRPAGPAERAGALRITDWRVLAGIAVGLILVGLVVVRLAGGRAF